MGVKPIPLPSLVLLFPLTFLIHDGEEILTFERWMTANHARVAAMAAGTPLAGNVAAMASMTTAAFSGAVLALFFVILIATWLMLRSLRRDRLNWTAAPFLIMLAIYTLNIVTHLGQSLLLGGYTPGVVTAVLVMTPYASLLYHRLFQTSLLTARQLLLTLLAGLVLGLPAVLLAHEIGRILTS